MTNCLAITRMLVALATIPACATADADVWYNTPAHQGYCGEECYTPATAWIDTQDGNYTFGMSCSNAMIMAGPAMMLPHPPFYMFKMLIDGQSLDYFSVYNILKDT